MNGCAQIFYIIRLTKNKNNIINYQILILTLYVPRTEQPRYREILLITGLLCTCTNCALGMGEKKVFSICDQPRYYYRLFYYYHHISLQIVSSSYICVCLIIYSLPQTSFFASSSRSIDSTVDLPEIKGSHRKFRTIVSSLIGNH